MCNAQRNEEPCMSTSEIKKNSVVDVKITKLSNQGVGIATVDGLSILIEDALVGEEGSVLIYRVENTFALGKWDKQTVKSKDRVEVAPKNKVLASMIPLIHLVYDRQLEFKTNLVKEAFSSIEGFDESCVFNTLGMENKWHYRNKAQIHVQATTGSMETGIVISRPRRLVQVDNFKVNLLGIDEIIAGVRDILIRFNEKGYNPKTHTGNIRQIIVRKGYATNQFMVIIVTRSKSLFPTSKIVPAIIEEFSNVVSVVHSVNNDKNNQGMGEVVQVLHGKSTYQEVVSNQTFDIGVASYFKANTLQFDVLISSLISSLDLAGNEVVVDTHCGVGVVALSLANHVKSVLGVDRFKENIDLATSNAINNDIKNVTFTSEDVVEVLKELKTPVDVLVVDPANKGLTTYLNEAIIKAAPKKIAYISTDLKTLVSDVQRFLSQGYTIETIVPIDMLPQTTLVECVVVLKKQ